MLPQGFRVPERRAEKSRSPCTIGGMVDTGTISLGFVNAVGTGSGSKGTGTVGVGLDET
jgi:hypothetical protein